jgi:flagellar biosynthesis protein FlhB
MAEENDSASKTEEPTQRKLDQARAKGDVPKTADLPQLASLAAAASVIAIAGGAMSRNLAEALIPFLAHPDTMSLEGAGGVGVARTATMAAAPILLGVLCAAALAGVAGNVVQTGLMFSPDKLAPDFNKISPGTGFKRLFGIDALVHFGKSLLKIILVGWIAWIVLKPHVHEFQTLSAMDTGAMLPFCAVIIRKLVFSVLAAMVTIAGFDWFWQRQRFMARMRMSKEEMKEDFKQSDGDPHIKARLRQLRIERSRRRMMQAVPTATLVVMNPTHYAVALKYEAGSTPAPLCVAKGVDSLALKIREVAEAAGVPVIEDAPLARALYASVDIDDTIPAAHYEAVAKIIGFILNAGRRVAGRL